MYTDSMIQSYQWFFVNIYWIIAFILIIVLLLWYYRKNARVKKLIILYVVLYLLGVNSVTKMIVTKVYPGGASTFYRLFWVLPVVILFAFTVALYLKKGKKILGILLCIACFAFFIVIAPWDEITEQGKLPETPYYVSNEIIELDDIMGADERRDYKKYFGSLSVYLSLEAYTDKLEFPFPRNCFTQYDEWIQYQDEGVSALFDSVMNGVKASKKERKKCKDILQSFGVDYLVIEKSKMISNYYEKMGYRLIGETKGYVVYERKDNGRDPD